MIKTEESKVKILKEAMGKKPRELNTDRKIDKKKCKN